MKKVRNINGVDTRKPKNEAEAAFYDMMNAKGWTVTKRGWPDFFCIRENEICVVEVKPHAKHNLKTNQTLILEKLAEIGVKCFRWSPDGGLVAIEAKTGEGNG